MGWSFEKEETWYETWSIAHGVLAGVILAIAIPASVRYALKYRQHRHHITLIKRRGNIALHQIFLLVFAQFLAFLGTIYTATEYHDDEDDQWGQFGVIFYITVFMSQFLTDFAIFWVSIARYYRLYEDIQSSSLSLTLDYNTNITSIDSSNNDNNNNSINTPQQYYQKGSDRCILFGAYGISLLSVVYLILMAVVASVIGYVLGFILMSLAFIIPVGVLSWLYYQIGYQLKFQDMIYVGLELKALFYGLMCYCVSFIVGNIVLMAFASRDAFYPTRFFTTLINVILYFVIEYVITKNVLNRVYSMLNDPRFLSNDNDSITGTIQSIDTSPVVNTNDSNI